MTEIQKIEGEAKTELQKFEGWIKTLELKFFKGKLHQKVVNPNPGETPDHAWAPIAAHDVDAPAAGEQIASHPSRRADDAPPGGLHAPTQAHYPQSANAGSIVPPGQEQGSAAGNPLPPGVSVATPAQSST